MKKRKILGSLLTESFRAAASLFGPHQVRISIRLIFHYGAQLNNMFTQPQTLAEIKKRVQDCIDELNQDEKKIRKIIANVHKRAEICIKQKGGHFEHMM